MDTDSVAALRKLQGYAPHFDLSPRAPPHFNSTVPSEEPGCSLKLHYMVTFLKLINYLIN